MAGAVCALRLPKIFNLRTDPFESADVLGDVYCMKWRAGLFLLSPAGGLVQQWIKTLAAFPPRQRPEHWSVGEVLEKLQQNAHALEADAGGKVKCDEPVAVARAGIATDSLVSPVSALLLRGDPRHDFVAGQRPRCA